MARVTRSRGLAPKSVAHPPRPRGRPIGSSKEQIAEAENSTPAPKPRGRPKGSGKKQASAESPVTPTSRSRGRPKGSGKKTDTATTDHLTATAKTRGRPRSNGKNQAASGIAATPKTASTVSKRANNAIKPKTTPNTSTKPLPSIAGTYALDSGMVENYGGENLADYMFLRVRPPAADSKMPVGIYEANFFLGLIHGAMLLCADEARLDAYVRVLAALDKENQEYDWVADGYCSEGDLKKEALRRFSQSDNHKDSEKSSRTDPSKQKFFLRWRGRETGQDMIMPEQQYYKGTITFMGAKCTTLEGEANFDFVKGAFSGKLADSSWDPVPFLAKAVYFDVKAHWSAFSWDNYEAERRSRWGGGPRYKENVRWRYVAE